MFGYHYLVELAFHKCSSTTWSTP